jgi:hypothetical protein
VSLPLGTCRGCGATVAWVKTTGGKNMPVDPEPVPHGNLILIDPIPGDDSYLAVNKSASDQPGYTSHFATCPDAGQFRRAR